MLAHASPVIDSIVTTTVHMFVFEDDGVGVAAGETGVTAGPVIELRWSSQPNAKRERKAPARSSLFFMPTSVHFIRSCRTRNKSDFDQETLTNLSAGLRAWVTGSAERRAGTLPEMPRWLAAPLSLLFWATCVLLVLLWTPLIAFYRLA